MEFPFDVRSLFPNEITRSVGGKLATYSLASASGRTTRHNHDDCLATIVDEMGIASAKAQGLRVPITTYQKLVASNHILYVMSDTEGQRGSIVGILKAGHKKLFLTDAMGVVREVEPLCVLDFYVHESRQRSGCGKRLFEEMLKVEGVKPFEIAIDRPSPKFLGFLKKHYQLVSFVKQANNFVVFDQFFSTCKDLGRQTRRFSLPSSAKKWTAEKRDPLTLFPTKSLHTPVKTSSAQLDTSAEFNWSVDNTSRTLNSNLSPLSPPRVREFNIITGHNHQSSGLSLKSKRSTDLYNGREDSNILKKIKLHQQSEPHLISNKAPHLNMRRGSKPHMGSTWPTNDELYHTTSTGHVTSGAGHVTSGAGHVTSKPGHVRYSRHAGGGFPHFNSENNTSSATRHKSQKHNEHFHHGHL